MMAEGNPAMAADKKKSTFDFKGQGTGMWIVMILFSSVWMFVLGIFVGRGTAPVKFDIQKLQKELIALKETVLKEEGDRFEAYMKSAQKKTNLGFYEALKAPDGETGSPETRAKKTSQGQRSASSPELTKTQSAAGAEGKNLTIQISSMRDSKAADAMVARLKKQGYKAYRTTGHIPDKGVWYRVRVGFYRNKEEAAPVVKRMKEDDYKPYLVKWQ